MAALHTTTNGPSGQPVKKTVPLLSVEEVSDPEIERDSAETRTKFKKLTVIPNAAVIILPGQSGPLARPHAVPDTKREKFSTVTEIRSKRNVNSAPTM